MQQRRFRALLFPLSTLALACAQATPPANSAPSLASCPRAEVAASAIAVDAGVLAAFDAAQWIDDLHTLIGEMSSHYANLEWAVNERKMDLPALKTKTEARLRDAKNEDDAKRALRSFVDAFGDAHFAIEWPAKGNASDAHGESSGATTGPLCARLGYGKQQAKPGVDLALTGRWTPIDDADSPDFAGGVLRLASGAKVGVLRIGLFMEQLHPAMCEAARKELALADDAKCDDECGDKLAKKVDDAMTAALERRALSLVHAGATAIAVDITGNGGGSNWVEPAARCLTPVPLRSPRMGFVRHEHWSKHLREELTDLEADRAQRKDDAILATAEATIHAAVDEASTPCDRSALWDAGKPKPTCTQLVTNRIFTSGLVPYAKAGAFDGWHSSDTLFSPREYVFHEGAVTLPLIVLVDGGTASASEQFAAMLADNHAALIVGSLTTGCGCGFTNGGIPTILPRSGANVHVPDCARLRANGANEASGLVPDVLLPLAGRDSPYQRAAKIEAGLAAAVKKLGTLARR